MSRYGVKRRGFSLTELIVVMAIFAVLAALLFPVFARSKERAKLTDCGTRLHGFAVALNLYRADHDDRGYVWGNHLKGGNRFAFPYEMFDGMHGYLGDGSTIWCPEPDADPSGISGWNLYHYGGFAISRGDVTLHVPARPAPGTVVAYCANHTKAEFDPRYAAHGDLRTGIYPFVREDTSLGKARNDSVQVLYYSDRQGRWFDTTDGTLASMFRFPGEPWPPTPEE